MKNSIKDIKDLAIKVFEGLGYIVEQDRELDGHTPDLFLRKKKSIGNRYECWICLIHNEEKKADKAFIDGIYPIREAIREELDRRAEECKECCDDCQAIIISETGFTPEAREAASVYKIECRTTKQLQQG